MKTESHYELGKYIGERYLSELDSAKRKAFVAGCVVPDYNLFSYLRGVRIKPFFGHNWNNSKKCVYRLFARVSDGCDTVRKYYLLGKLVHYVTDGLTHTHNAAFHGSLAGHTVYELKLHSNIVSGIRRESAGKSVNLFSASDIEKLHRDYELTEKSGENRFSCDTEYIFSASLALVRELSRFPVKINLSKKVNDA